MLARLAPERGDARRVARPLVLALCALAAGAGVWSAWTAPPAPEVSAQPLAPPPPTADVIAEPGPEPSSSARAPSWAPRRVVPALPLLLPRSDRAPLSPPSDPWRSPVDAPRPERPSRAALAQRAPEPDVLAVEQASSPSHLAPAPRSLAWSIPAGAAPGERPPARTPPGLAGPERRQDSAPRHEPGSPIARDDAPPDPVRAEPAHTTPSASANEPDPCTWTAVSLAPVCLDPGEIKLLASDTCDGMGLTLTDLLPAFDCADQGSTVVKVKCCDLAALPAAEPEKTCKQLVTGDGLTCVDAGELLKEAEATCASWGLAFTKPEPWETCGAGGATHIMSWCCPVAESAPGPPPAGVVGDGLACTLDEKLEALAVSICESLGQETWTGPGDDKRGQRAAKGPRGPGRAGRARIARSEETSCELIDRSWRGFQSWRRRRSRRGARRRRPPARAPRSRRPRGRTAARATRLSMPMSPGAARPPTCAPASRSATGPRASAMRT